MKLTLKGARITKRVAAEELLAHIYIAKKVGACRVETEVKRRHDYVFELVVRRPR